MIKQQLELLKQQEQEIKELRKNSSPEEFKSIITADLKEMTLDYINISEVIIECLDDVQNENISADMRVKVKAQFADESTIQLSVIQEIKDFIEQSDEKEILKDIVTITLVSSKPVLKRIPGLYEEIQRIFPELQK